MATKESGQQLIGWSKIVMIGTGFWKLPITKYKFIQKSYEVYSLFAKISYILFWFLLIAELIRITVCDYSTQLKFQALSVVVNASKIGMKTIIYLKYDVMAMVKDVIEKEQEVWASSSEEIKNIYRAKIRICKVYVAIIGGITITAVGFLQISGAFAMVQVKHYSSLVPNETVETNFMYLTLFPRDKLNNLYVTFSLQALWGWIGMNFNTMTQVVFITLLTYSSCQLELLQVKMKNFIEPNFTEHLTKEENDEKIAVLKSLILQHKYIIGFTGHLNKCTKFIIMMEYILSSLDLASVSTNLINMELTQSEVGWRLLFFLLLSSQIFILSWSCNEIKVQSEAIADALYESKWYLLNKEGKQIIQIIIARSQRPLKMTIGDFGPMTNNSALVVIKAAYSYVSLFR